MGSRRWPRVRTELLRRAARLGAALLLSCCIPRAARADVAIAPSHDGYLGAWLAVGPIPEAAGAALDVRAIEPRLGAAPAGSAPFRLLHAADAAIDLKKQLRSGDRAGPYALLGGVLDLRDDFDGYLFVAADGGVSAVLDGQVLWSRDSVRLRGASWDVIPFKAAAGRHPLLLKLHQRSEHWAVMVRVLDRARLVPPRGALLLPGAGPNDAARLAKSMLSMTVAPGLSAGGYRPRLGLAYRRGMPLGQNTGVVASADVGARRLFEVRLGDVPAGERGVFPLAAELPLLDAASIEASGKVVRLSITAQVGAAQARQPLVLAAEAPAAWLRAKSLEARIEADFKRLTDAKLTRTTLEWQRRRLENLGVGKTAAEGVVLRGTKRVADLVATIEAGSDPLHRAGIQSLAHPSRADGSLQSFRVHVPASFRPGSERRYPLVVLLHGYNGRPSSVLKAFIDRKRGKAAHAAIDGFLVAPAAHDNGFYRGASEREVLDVLDLMLRLYPIDPERVSITGVSMGGTGAAQIGLRYADRFAAAAPLCGYHSYFVRRDVTGKPLHDWEKPLLEHWSPASFAENARDLPFYVAHGTKDYPLENSRVLVRRLKELGYSIRDEWPETGHAVWEKVYANAGLWPWLSRAKRSSEPRHVTLKTDSLRYGSRDWVRVTALEASGRSARVDARLTSAVALDLTTSGVLGLELARPAALSTTEPVTVTADGRPLVFPPGAPIAVHRAGGSWQSGAGPRPPIAKRAGLEGPIRDAFLDALVFVYGSGDPATLRANREVAEAFASGRDTAKVHYPVLADSEIGATTAREHTLFLVGTPRDNAVLRRLAPGLPLGLDGNAVRVGSELLTGKEIGLLFIHPNPEAPERYVVVLGAPDVAGLYRAISLPKLLPDWIVYDERVAGASAQQVLGDARVLNAGFFDAAWRLPQAPAPAPP